MCRPVFHHRQVLCAQCNPRNYPNLDHVRGCFIATIATPKRVRYITSSRHRFCLTAHKIYLSASTHTNTQIYTHNALQRTSRERNQRGITMEWKSWFSWEIISAKVRNTKRTWIYVRMVDTVQRRWMRAFPTLALGVVRFVDRKNVEHTHTYTEYTGVDIAHTMRDDVTVDFWEVTRRDTYTRMGKVTREERCFCCCSFYSGAMHAIGNENMRYEYNQKVNMGMQNSIM